MEEGFMGNFYKFMEWITRFLFVNVLWMFFSLLGLIIFGFFPATTAMFTIVRKWLQSEADIPIFKTFWDTYKKDFFKSNGLGYILCIIGYVFYLDILIVKNASHQLLQLAFYPLSVIIILYVLTLLYIFPVFVHFETKLMHVLKNALLIMMLHPVISILMGTGAIIVFIIFYFVPVLIPLFGGSVSAFVLMWYSNFAFVKVQERKQISDQDDQD